MLYLIHQTNTNAYKIGYTTNLDSRMNSYRTSMAYFEFIGTKEGSMEDEEEYHKRLIEYRINKSEWFELPDEIIEVIIKEFDMSYEYSNIIFKMEFNNDTKTGAFDPIINKVGLNRCKELNYDLRNILDAFFKLNGHNLVKMTDIKLSTYGNYELKNN